MITVRDAVAEDGEYTFRDCQARGWEYAYSAFLPAEIIARVTSQERILRCVNGYADFLAERYAKGGIQLVAVNEQGRVIGFLGGGEARDKEIAEAELYGIYVNPDYIGCGAGRALIEEFVRRITAKNVKTFYLECFSENKSIGFYKHMHGVVVKEYDSGEKYAHHLISVLKFNLADELFN